MERATGRIFTELRTTGHGSDFYGNCEVCGKHVSETHVMQRRMEYQRENGQKYFSPIGGGIYGHRDCLGIPDIDRTV